MGLQATRWMQSEANEWHERNHRKFSDSVNVYTSDPVIRALVDAKIEPREVFEVGCGNGYRLAAMRDYWQCKVWGCDLSEDAIRHGIQTYGTNNMQIGIREAANLKGLPTGGFDLVIYGFCLYQCDPEELFQIVREGDRILDNNGYLVVYDFKPDYPHSKNYKYDRALRTYKMDYSRLWLAHPHYSIYHQRFMSHDAEEDVIDHNNRVAVTILKKSVEGGFPLEP